MQIKTNEQGYVTDFAFIGAIDGAVEVPEPQDMTHFEDHFTAYKLTDGVLTFDADKAAAIDAEAVKDALRVRRRTECFPVINRGGLWYQRLTAEQKAELEAWYDAWLDAPETLEEPETPEWLKGVIEWTV